MSQIFPRSANALARASLASVLGLVLVGGWISVKHWIGKVLNSVGKTYQTLDKAEADEVITRDEYADIGEAATPFLVELRQRARGLTPFKWRF